MYLVFGHFNLNLLLGIISLFTGFQQTYYMSLSWFLGFGFILYSLSSCVVSCLVLLPALCVFPSLLIVWLGSPVLITSLRYLVLVLYVFSKTAFVREVLSTTLDNRDSDFLPYFQTKYGKSAFCVQASNCQQATNDANSANDDNCA